MSRSDAPMTPTPSGTPTPMWSCENKRGKCREPHGCHCREIEALRADRDRLRKIVESITVAEDGSYITVMIDGRGHWSGIVSEPGRPFVASWSKLKDEALQSTGGA